MAIEDDAMDVLVVGGLGIGGFDVDTEVHLGFFHTFDLNFRGGSGQYVIAAVAIFGHYVDSLDASRFRSDIKRDDTGTLCRHLGLHDGRVLRVFVELLAAKVQVEVAEEALVTIVFDGGMHLFLGAHLVFTSEGDETNLQFLLGMIDGI